MPKRRASGFSVLELVIVMFIISVMIGIAIFAVRPARNADLPERAAYLVMDYLREAQSRALAERRVMRVEIVTVPTGAAKIRLIDQNALTATEFVVREEPLPQLALAAADTRPGYNVLRMDVPTNAAGTALSVPAAPYNFSAAPITPPATGTSTWAIRFSSFGSACDASLLPVSATLFFYVPKQMGGSSVAALADGVRAVTISGPGGSIRYWKYRTSAGGFTSEGH